MDRTPDVIQGLDPVAISVAGRLIAAKLSPASEACASIRGAEFVYMPIFPIHIEARRVC
jgi:hypothetical protein